MPSEAPTTTAAEPEAEVPSPPDPIPGEPGDIRRSRVYLLSRGPVFGLVRRAVSVAALVAADVAGLALGVYLALVLRSFVYGTPFFGGEEKVVEYLTRMKENNPRHVKGDADANTLLVAGEFPILIGAYLHNTLKYEPKGQPWGFAPLSEVYVGPQGPGYTVPEKAPHRQAGRLFLHWLVGPEGIALMDQLRFKGNPAPGSGTGPSKYLEERKIVPRTSTLEYEINYAKYEKQYGAALGLVGV